ncbi:MAG: TipAS antibiotic-recognition domain-containing protein [Oscillospiraceae bacterium]|nr:TipAS antibiotic-recognition domain-containing protein [Oscillospiraceae bacterium]
MGMRVDDYNKSEKLRLEFEDTIKTAFMQGSPASEMAQRACDLHRQWLCYFYDGYCKEYHTGLAEMYVQDERFKEHYERIAVGITEFLRDAIYIYCE